MTITIALAGKGGVGKTTISAMVIKYLVQNKPGPVLAIDADPSSNLNMVLGLDLDWTVGDIREDMLLIAMGRSEGTGCYCAVNHNLREVIDSISKNYRYIVIDNEAGMEHLSRRTTRDVQHLLIVSDPTQRGIVAAERIASFRNDLDIHIENAYLIINRLSEELPFALQTEVDRLGIPLLGTVVADIELSRYEFTGKPLVDLGNDSPVYQAVAGMMSKIL
jgi:CO dehydrogenase maturation factor